MLETKHLNNLPQQPYISNAFRMLLNVTKNKLLNSTDLLVIKGEQGIGKTTFCQQLRLELKHDAQTIIINSDPNLHANDVFKKMLFRYQQKPEDDLKNCLSSLSHYLKATIQAVGVVVLVIDDCHLVYPKHLEYILQSLEAFDEILHSKLKILLVGESSIEHNLSQIKVNSINKGTVVSSVIRPIAKENTADYLKHCCSVDPLHTIDEPKLTNTQLITLYQSSKGIPALINSGFEKTIIQGEHATAKSMLDSSQFYFSSLSKKAKGLSEKLGIKPS